MYKKKQRLTAKYCGSQVCRYITISAMGMEYTVLAERGLEIFNLLKAVTFFPLLGISEY